MYIAHSEGILNISCGWVGGLVAEAMWWVVGVENEINANSAFN